MSESTTLLARLNVLRVLLAQDYPEHHKTVLDAERALASAPQASQPPQGVSEFRKALESLTHEDMPGGNLWEVTTVRQKSLMLKAWRATLSAPPQGASSLSDRDLIDRFDI